jgi:hypothetical protein
VTRGRPIKPVAPVTKTDPEQEKETFASDELEDEEITINVSPWYLMPTGIEANRSTAPTPRITI